MQAADGYLYGPTAGDYGAPPLRRGTIFRSDLEGQVTTIHQFVGADGQNPRAPLLQASDGNFYGTAYAGGGYGYGLVFQLTPAGAFTPLHHFNHADGALPEGRLVEGLDGRLYGTTAGTNENHDYGTVFGMAKTGAFESLHAFTSASGTPRTALVFGADGALYGTTNTTFFWYPDPEGPVPGTIFRMETTGEFTTLHTFYWEDGSGPALIQGSDGDFYGTTAEGGTNNLGTVFRLKATGDYEVLHSFDGADGSTPTSLFQGIDGNFYGSTTFGGAANMGTIFRATGQGEVTTLHEFHRRRRGRHPERSDAGLGRMALRSRDVGWDRRRRTLFRMDLGGSFQNFVYFSLEFGDGGIHPNGPLVSCGDVCGTTQDGGEEGSEGATFKAFTNGSRLFDNGLDVATEGGIPLTGLANIDGELFGTTSVGGEGGNGTIFLAGGYDVPVLHAFAGDGHEGAAPAAPLVYIDTPEFSGIYGTASQGGLGGGSGTIFRIDFGGNFEVVHSFSGIAGDSPDDAMIQAWTGTSMEPRTSDRSGPASSSG
jgi:uncharacterized repeat protein (TIGR03803 family)